MNSILSFPKVPETKGEAETYLYLRTLGILKKSFWNFSKREVPYAIAVRDREPMPKTAKEAENYLDKLSEGKIKLGFGSTMKQEVDHCMEILLRDLEEGARDLDAADRTFRLLAGYSKIPTLEKMVLDATARIMGVESITKHPTPDDK